MEFCEQVVKAEKGGVHIIVDGHYAFPQKNGDGYEVVFTEADKNLYDVFIYMNTPSDRIVANVKLGESGRANTFDDVSILDQWKAFEITELKRICRELGKELVVLDGEIECCCDFLCDLATHPEDLLAGHIVRNIWADNQTVLNRCDTILLMDCDRTITVGDTTYDFCENAGIDKSILKAIFKGEHYSTYQFYRFNKHCDTVIPDNRFYQACLYAAEKARLNDRLLADIRTQLHTICVIGITSGVANTWLEIQRRIGLPQIIIGKGRGNINGHFVSTAVKYMVADMLRKKGKHVMALGDSVIDVPMLETADKGFIVAEEKISSGVKSYFEGIGVNTTIKQFDYSKFKYDNIKKVGSLWE